MMSCLWPLEGKFSENWRGPTIGNNHNVVHYKQRQPSQVLY